jgi:hypothetical protein
VTGRVTDLDRLAADAASLAWQLHDEDPAAVHAALARMGRLQLEQVCCALAAMVDVDRTVAELLAWTARPARRLRAVRREKAG